MNCEIYLLIYPLLNIKIICGSKRREVIVYAKIYGNTSLNMLYFQDLLSTLSSRILVNIVSLFWKQPSKKCVDASWNKKMDSRIYLKNFN
jgi:hypothetical protein